MRVRVTHPRECRLGPGPPPGLTGSETLAQVSRDLYLLYRIHLLRLTQEFHFLSLV